MERLKKAVSIAALMFFGLWVDGCNDCNVNGKIDNTPGDIVFSALPLNINEYSIFTVERNGSKLREYIPNAKLFSAPDTDHKICWLEVSGTGEKSVYLSSITGADKHKVISGNYYPDLQMPVLSFMGELIAFYGGDKRLLMTRANQGMPDIISNECHNAFIPAFSANGDFLMFFSSAEDSLYLNVISTTSLESVYQKAYSAILAEYHIHNRIALDRDNNRAIFSITLKDSTSVIGVFDFNDLKHSEYNIENPFIMNPELSGNELRVIFSGSDGNLWIKDLADQNFVAVKLTDVSGDEYCTYVNQYLNEDLILYTQISKSGYSGGILKILNVENKEETVLSSQVFMGYWLRKEKVN
jgi:hypothetical protein